MTLYEPQSARVILADLRADINDRVGVVLDFTGDDPLGPVTASIAGQLANADARLGVVVANTDPETAVDDGLDALARITGVSRRAATKSRYTVRAISSDTPRTLPSGAILEGGGTNDLQRWTVVSDVVVGTSETEVVIEAEQAGVVTLSGATVTTFRKVTPATNITVSYDPADGDSFTVGRSRETDGELRVSRRSRLASPASASEPGVRSAVLNAGSWVEACVPTEEATGIRVTVVPEPVGTDRQAAILAAIFQSKALGVATLGAESGTVTGPDGVTEYTVRYDVGTTQAVTVAVASLQVAAGFDVDDVQLEIVAAIQDLFATLGLGDVLYWIKAAAAFGRVPGALGGTLTLDGGSGNVTPSIGTTLLVLDGDTVSFT